MKLNITNITVPLNSEQNEYIYKEIEKLGIKKDNVIEMKYSKRSIDSRNKNDIKLVYNIEITLKNDFKKPLKNNMKIIEEDIKIKKENLLPKSTKIAVIGAGPAGLFAAYSLCKLGYTPHIFERGEKIEDRDITIENFIKTSKLDPNSNVQFGEGGAGTYSDGKLNTRIKSGFINEVFEILVACGAQDEIMWDYKPHIGTDVLKKVITNLRNKIISMGGIFFFSSKLEKINAVDNNLKSIEIKTKDGVSETLYFDKLFLATGHSARDTYRMLNNCGFKMENKAFAVGVRMEHPRTFIDTMMFGKNAGHPLLGTATYSLTHNNKEDGRGIFSFCMCPGGVIVNAASEEGGTLVNGMSYSDRKKEFSNSALVVTVKENEFGNHLFSGMEWQEKIEREAYKMAGGYKGLFQTVTDFLNNKSSSFARKTSYEMELTPCNIHDLFPNFITDNMKSALTYWGKIYKGFISEDAHLIGPETRTSSPVRVLRDENGESLSIKGVFPIGEGAGYAGGITSAAVDGLKIVDISFSKVSSTEQV